MSRTLTRPMFRMGGSAGTGITSGLDRKPLKQGTDPYDRAMKTTERFMTDMDKFRGEKPAFAPSALPGFLTQFGLNLLATPPRGNIFQTAAVAAQDPFKTFQAATLKREQDIADRREDMFGTALASEYDLERERIESEGKGSEKTFAKEQAANAVTSLYDNQIGAIKNKIEQLDQENDPNYLEKINQFNQQIADIEKRKTDDIKSIYLSQKTIEEFQREVILKLLQNNDIEDILPFFPNFEQIMGPGF